MRYQQRPPSMSLNLHPTRSTLPSVLFSSHKMDWETPPEVFHPLHKEFRFTLDACALPATAKVNNYFTPADDGLEQSWRNQRVWMNPPYGRDIGRWMDRAWEAAAYERAIVVALVPARTDTQWWHEYVMASDAEVRYVRGRIRFLNRGRRHDAATFPSAVVIYRPPHVWKAMPDVVAPTVYASGFSPTA